MAEIRSIMEDSPWTQICLISNNNTVTGCHFERQYRISNYVAHHLLCQNGKSLKYLKTYCQPAKLWIPYIDDWKFDMNITREIMIKGNSKEEVDNAEILMNTFIRNKTCHMMVSKVFYFKACHADEEVSKGYCD